ncbi:MAG TPA: MBL fold metallo-hydrolase [Thermoanaerobaculia bacterium]|nr:MBL fold metallo-hydrolase [Thermoanaerobaculia bacterium]
MWLERLTVGPLAENCYLVGAPAGDELVIVDPGAESDRIAAAIAASGRRPVAILLTHGHIDHIAHCAHLAEQYGIGVWVHREDQPLLAGPQWPELAEALAYRPCPEPAGWLEEGSPVRFAGLHLEVVHTPGHTPGGVCFVERASRRALVGDTLFHRGVGRTDLPGGDGPTLVRSIRDRLFALEGDYLCWPGHGPETRLAEERLENPFVGARARYAPW